MVQEKVQQIQKNISNICQRLGRNPKEITLIGVTKFAPVEKIEDAISAGVAHIAENKVQEAQKKFPQLKHIFPNLTCHMIGHLQTNKVKDAILVCDMIQSVDSLKLAQEIEKQANKLDRHVDVLIQVKTSDEEEKYGIDPENTLPLIEEVSKLKRVRIQGLMTMAPFTEDKKIVRACFRELKEIRAKAVDAFRTFPNVQFKYLSMGMTDDYEIALEEGSNMVRVGRAIFQ